MDNTNNNLIQRVSLNFTGTLSYRDDETGTILRPASFLYYNLEDIPQAEQKKKDLAKLFYRTLESKVDIAFRATDTNKFDVLARVKTDRPSFITTDGRFDLSTFDGIHKLLSEKFRSSLAKPGEADPKVIAKITRREYDAGRADFTDHYSIVEAKVMSLEETEACYKKQGIDPMSRDGTFVEVEGESRFIRAQRYLRAVIARSAMDPAYSNDKCISVFIDPSTFKVEFLDFVPTNIAQLFSRVHVKQEPVASSPPPQLPQSPGAHQTEITIKSEPTQAAPTNNDPIGARLAEIQAEFEAQQSQEEDRSSSSARHTNNKKRARPDDIDVVEDKFEMPLSKRTKADKLTPEWFASIKSDLRSIPAIKEEVSANGNMKYFRILISRIYSADKVTEHTYRFSSEGAARRWYEFARTVSVHLGDMAMEALLSTDVMHNPESVSLDNLESDEISSRSLGKTAESAEAFFLEFLGKSSYDARRVAVLAYYTLIRARILEEPLWRNYVTRREGDDFDGSTIGMPWKSVHEKKYDMFLRVRQD